MKKVFRILSFVLVLSLSFILVACGKPTQLEAPVISLNETIVSWSEVEFASSYLVIVNEEEFEINDLSYDLKAIIEDSYSIYVIAVGDGKDFSNSEKSNEIKVVPIDLIEYFKVGESGNVHSFNIQVQSDKPILGIQIELEFKNGTISESGVKWLSLRPASWITSVNQTTGKVTIATTGLSSFDARFMQTFLTLDFEVESGKELEITKLTFEIDN